MTTDNPPILLVLTVGTTEEPLLKAVKEVVEPCDVVLFYGHSLEQVQAPIQVAARVRERALEQGFSTCEFEVSDPENIETTLAEMEAALRPFLDREWSGIRFNITGGTKVMSGALAHLAHRVLGGQEVLVEYTGGRHRNAAGRVVGPMHTTSLPLWRQHSRHTVDLLRSGQYQAAYAWSRVLPPQEGEAGFVRAGMEALAQWDRMEYQAAHAGLREMAAALQFFRGNASLDSLVQLLERIKDAAAQMMGALHRLGDSANLQQLDPPGLPANFIEGMRLLAVDALVNAERRVQEGRHTDAALRSYRAVEVACQRALLARGVSPWNRDDQIGLEAGLVKLEGMNEQPLALDWADIRRLVRGIQSVRNYSFLEHGYTPVSCGMAKSSLEAADHVVTGLMEACADEMGEMRRNLSFSIE